MCADPISPRISRGDLAMISPSDDITSSWSIDHIYSTGHGDIVRCVLWDEPVSLVLSICVFAFDTRLHKI